MPIRRMHRRPRRSGLAALEVVMTTAAVIPALIFLLYLGIYTMRAFMSIIGAMVGSPCM